MQSADLVVFALNVLYIRMAEFDLRSSEASARRGSMPN